MPASSFLTLFALCVGACTGAVLRWKLGHWFSPASGLPWGTLIANASGGLLIGCVAGMLQAHPAMDPVWRVLLVTGFLGALTTFSTFSLEVVQLALAQRWGMALAWCALQLTSSLVLTATGILASHAFWQARAA